MISSQKKSYFLLGYILVFSVLLTSEFLVIKSTSSPKSSDPISYSYKWHALWGEPGYYDTARAVGFDSFENIYAGGHTRRPSGYFDFCLIKYNSSGEKIWEKIWGGSGDDFCLDMKIDSYDNIYQFGYTFSFGASMCIVKYNSSGDLQWYRTWGGSSDSAGFGGALDSNDDVYVIGKTRDPVKDDQYCLVKYDKSGVYQWNHVWGGNADEFYEGITIDSNDNIYVVGYVFKDSQSKSDACVVKYDSSGSPLWNITWGGSSYERFNSIALDSLNNIYIGGYAESYGSGWCLVKFNNAGILQWYEVLGGSSTGDLRSIYIDSSDNIYLTGNMYNNINSGSLSDVVLAKYDTSGNQLWSLNWGGNNHEVGYDLILNSNNDIYIAGSTSLIDNDYGDLCLIKFILDSDLDGLSDSSELNIYFTNPFNPDTDEDGLSDNDEINLYLTDPNESDTDGDTMPDGWELDNLLNPLIFDALLDPDNDELFNVYEYQEGTDPNNPDTDGDRWRDGEEVLRYNTDPLNPDDNPGTRIIIIIISSISILALSQIPIILLILKRINSRKLN